MRQVPGGAGNGEEHGEKLGRETRGVESDASRKPIRIETRRGLKTDIPKYVKILICACLFETNMNSLL